MGQWLWSKATRSGTSVTTKIHGTTAQIPADYTYPLICRNFTTFNNPYLELVHQTWLQKRRPLNIIDVGAAIGDTFLLIMQNDPEAVNTIFCVEGNAFFLKYLKENTTRFYKAIIIETLLSDKDGLIPELVSLHSSTASALGDNKVAAKKLDTVFGTINSSAIDVLKIDVDGFDGKVLAGSANLLKKNHPSIIFEFHPLLINKTGNDIFQPFQMLKDCGYEMLYWYNKFGVYSHSLAADDKIKIQYYADRCINGEDGEDWHYDIIALHKGHSLDTDALQKCTFASNKPFPF
jgi:FkbM family methyltransferase